MKELHVWPSLNGETITKGYLEYKNMRMYCSTDNDGFEEDWYEESQLYEDVDEDILNLNFELEEDKEDTRYFFSSHRANNYINPVVRELEESSDYED